jgi:hypothetical protein
MRIRRGVGELVKSQTALGAFAVLLAIACAGLNSCVLPIQVLPISGLEHEECRVDAVTICGRVSERDVMRAAAREAAFKQHPARYATLTTQVAIPDGVTLEVVCSYTVPGKKVAYAHAWTSAGGRRMIDFTPQSGIVGDTQESAIPPLDSSTVAYLRDNGLCSNLAPKGRQAN